MKAMHRIIPTLAVVLAAACAPGATMDGAAGPAQKTATPATVTVQNSNWLDVVVYVVSGTQRQRLGMVTALGTQTFRIPRGAMGNGRVQVFADPVGSTQGYLSESISVQPGQRLALDVGQNLSHSFLAIRN